MARRSLAQLVGAEGIEPSIPCTHVGQCAVAREGIEPPRLAAPDLESGASANSAIGPFFENLIPSPGHNTAFRYAPIIY